MRTVALCTVQQTLSTGHAGQYIVIVIIFSARHPGSNKFYPATPRGMKNEYSREKDPLRDMRRDCRSQQPERKSRSMEREFLFLQSPLNLVL